MNKYSDTSETSTNYFSLEEEVMSAEGLRELSHKSQFLLGRFAQTENVYPSRFAQIVTKSLTEIRSLTENFKLK